MILEMHCHTYPKSACSSLSPEELLRRAVRKGLDGVVITEHHYLWLPHELEALRHDACITRSFLILSGQEVDTELGHMLVFGASETLSGGSVQEIRQRFPDCALVWAHPWRNGRRPDPRDLQRPLLDAIEIFNENHTALDNYHALKQWHQHRFIAIAGSDAHDIERVGGLPTQFDHPVATVEELAAEIRAGRCRPLMKEHTIEGRNSVVRKLVLGTKGLTPVRTRYIIRQNRTNHDSWQRTEDRIALMQAIRNAGMTGRLRAPRVIAKEKQQGVVIEEGLRGKRLSELMHIVSNPTRVKLVHLALDWAAHLHKARIRHTSLYDSSSFIERKLLSYHAKFANTRNPYTSAAHEIIDFLRNHERRLYSEAQREILVQVHGDFQPDNIIVGQDLPLNPETDFAAAVDFDQSFLSDPAFDIGYFFAQVSFQFRGSPHILQSVSFDSIGAYWAAGMDMPFDTACKNRLRLAILYANISIMAFLIMVGMGTSRELRELMDASFEQYHCLHSQ